MNKNGENMLRKDIRVEAFWDEEAHVWVASSDDVPGLVTEADTMEHLMQKVKILIPELLQLNGLLDERGTVDIPIHLLGKWEEVIKAPTRNGGLRPQPSEKFYLKMAVVLNGRAREITKYGTAL